MKETYKCILKSLLKDSLLLAFLIFSIVVVIDLGIVKFGFPERFNNANQIAKVVVNLGLAYIAAFFFYFFTIIIPKCNEFLHINSYLAHLLGRIRFHILMVMEDACANNIPQQRFILENLDIEIIKEAMTGVFFHSRLPKAIADDEGRIINPEVGQSVVNHLKKIEDKSDELLKYIKFLDPEIIGLLMDIKESQSLELWINSVESEQRGLSINGYQLRSQNNRDISGYSSWINELNEIHKDLGEVIINDYSWTPAAKKIVKSESSH